MSLKDFFEKSKSQENEIRKQQNTIKQNNANVAEANKYFDALKKPFIYESTWVTVTPGLLERYVSSPGITQKHILYEWDVDLGVIPTFLYPFIYPQIIYNSEDNLFDLSTGNDWNFYTKFNFYESGSHLHVVGTILFSTSDSDNFDEIPDATAKLLVVIRNPNTYL